MIFFKAFRGISNVSQNGLKKLFKIIEHQTHRAKIDSKKSNLSSFNMMFYLKLFAIYHIYHKGLKKLFYNNKMTTYAELMEILKANEIRGYSHYTKSKLIDLLIKRRQIPEKYAINKQVKQRRI